jgi:hypothetical protein
MQSKVAMALSCLSALVLLAGCGQSGTSGERMLADSNQTNLDRVCTLYFQYQLNHGGTGPADEASFKEYIRELPAKQLERIGVEPSDIDAVFLSDRDDAAFEILWGVYGDQRGEPVAIVAESVGQEGMRMIGFNKKPHREVGEAEYKRLFGR